VIPSHPVGTTELIPGVVETMTAGGSGTAPTVVDVATARLSLIAEPTAGNGQGRGAPGVLTGRSSHLSKAVEFCGDVCVIVHAWAVNGRSTARSRSSSGRRTTLGGLIRISR
jgi:hypothetical protein